MRWLLSIVTALAGGGALALLLEGLVWDGGVGGLRALVALLAAGLATLAAGSIRALDGPRGELVSNLWLAAISSVAVIVAFDLAAGALLLSRLSPPAVPDPVVHHRLEPDTRSEFRTSEFQYVQRVNSLGLRGEEIERAKPPGTYRILLLGDSFAMGKGVADDRTFAALLGERLEPADGGELQVLNAGVDSYAPILSYLQFRERLQGVEPDLVLLALDMSDLLQEQAYRGIARFGEDGRPTAVPAPDQGERKPTLRLRDWLYEHTYLTRLALYRLRNRAAADGTPTVEEAVSLANAELLAHTLAGDDVDRSGQWRDLFDSIERIRELANERGADFALVVYPWGHQVGAAEWSVGRRNFLPPDAEVSDRTLEEIRRRSEAAGIELIDTVPAFRAADRGPLFFEIDMHLTEAGHRLVAERLATRLAARPDLESRGD